MISRTVLGWSILCLSLLFIIGCSDNKKEIVLVHGDSLNYIRIDPALKINGGDHPVDIIVRDSLLFIQQFRSEDQLCIYSLRNGELSSLVKTGRGPGEMIALYDFAISPSGKLSLYDTSLNLLYNYPVDSISKGSQITVPSVSPKINKTTYGLNTLCYKGETLYATGSVNDARIYSIDDNGERRVITRYSPDTKNGKLDKFINQAYMGTIAYNPRHDAFVISCLYSDQIELFDCSSEVVRFIKGPEMEEPKYKIVPDYGGTLAHLPEEMTAYRRVRTNGDRIFALFSGNRKDYSELRVFDWSGNLVKVFLVPHSSMGFDIDDDGTLYVANSEMILVYRAGEFLQ